MPRALKTYATHEAINPAIAAPKRHAFTVDLSGLDLSQEQLDRVNQAATRAAMVAAAAALREGAGRAMDGFGTFGTFSTFSTFASGAGFLGEEFANLPREVQAVINQASEAGG